MAEPARKPVYDSDDSSPIVRPRLHSVDGGGEGDGKSKGKLNAVDNPSSKSLDKPSLRALEGGAKGDGKPKGKLGLAGKDESDKLGRGFTGDDTKKQFFGGKRFNLKNWTKKKVATYATIGVLGGGTIFGGTILQGPFQLVHFGQLLTKFHLQARQDESDSRVGKLSRYMYYLKGGYGAKGGVERTRMGILGNKYADKITDKMARSGIEPDYNKTTGFDNGYKITPADLEGSDFEKNIVRDKKGNIDHAKTTKNIQKTIKTETGLDVTITRDGDTYKIKGDRGILNSRKLLKFMLRKSGYGRFSSAMLYRPMAKRAGITLHPLKAADRVVLEKAEEAYKKWRASKESEYSGGDKETIKGRRGTQSDENTDEGSKNDAEKSDKVRADAEKELGDARDSTGPRESKISTAMESKTFKAGMGLTALTGVLCLVKDINDGAVEYKESKVILPAMRIAGDFISTGSQIQDGNKDLDMARVGFYSKQLNGVDDSGNKSSWMDATTTRSELKKDGGRDANGTLKSIGKGGPFDGFLGTPPINLIVGPACSTTGKIIAGAVGVIAGPISAAVTTPIGILLGPTVMGQLIDWLSPNPLNLFPVGADLGNTANFGTRLIARQQGASTGGRELSTTESAQRRLEVDEESKQEISTKNIAYRLFNLKDYRSLASQTLDNQTLSTQNIASVLSYPLKPMGKIFSSLFTPKIFADSSGYDYGFNDIGFSSEELDSASVENPYKNADEVVKTILPTHPEYIDRAKKCMGVEIDPSTYDVTSLQAGDSNLKTKDLKSSDCTDKSQTYLKFRMYVFDTETMMTLACYEADDSNPDDAEGTQACSDLSAGSVSNDDDTSPIDGDAKSLAQEILDSPNVTYPYTDTHGMNVKTVMTEIKNTGMGPVNGDNASNKGHSVEVSANLLRAILEYAKTNKIGLNALTNATHSPTSNHYKGIAIDIACDPALNINKWNRIAGKYGGKNNGEVCPGNAHWHYDFDK